MGQHLTSLRACQGAPRNLWCTEKISKMYLLTITLLLSSCIAVAQAQTSTGTKAEFSAHAVVNFQELAQQEKLHPATIRPQATAVPQMSQPALPVPEGAAIIHLQNRMRTAPEVSSAQSSLLVPFSAPISPAPSQSFAAVSDNHLRIPPSAQGAVSPNYLVVTVNGTFVVQNRTGGLLQTVLMDNFWAPVGGVTGAVNARVAYDPYNSRFIITAEANGNTSSSALLIGVSTSSNPTSTWNLFKVNSDPGYWANFPSLGFNANWIAVSMNMYPLSSGCGGCLFQENVYVFNKAQLYSNVLGTVNKFTDTSGAGTYAPAVTFDNNPSTPLYLLEKWNENSNGFGYLRIGSITGSVSVPNMNFQVSFVAFGNPWAFTGGIVNGGFAPQASITTKIDTDDDRMQSLTYRSGALWGAQTTFLPASAPTHSAVLWYGFDPTNVSNGFYDFIDDPTGNEFRAYPSIAVNKFDDVLIGYSTFSATGYASAAYSFSGHSDLVPVEGERQLIAGRGPYSKFYGTTTNFWGFDTGTVVDGANDTDLWTIQEFADFNSGSGPDSGNWATWWGKISIPTHFFVSAPANATAGTPFSVTVTAQDTSNNTVVPYTGTVHFTATGSSSVPPDYTFVPGDNGVHTFVNGFTLNTAGNRTLSATDVSTLITGNAPVAVTAGAAKSFSWSVPLTATLNTAFSGTLTAFDNFNNIATTYTGSVQLSTTGTPAVTLPAPNPYTFTSGASSDNGIHTFAFTATSGTGSTFTITGNDAGNTINATSAAIRVTTDAPITGAGHRIRMFRSNVPVVLATFTDSDAGETGANLSATINWGDASTSPGVVVRVGTTNKFNVMGAHNYAKKTMYTVTVTLSDSNGGPGGGSAAAATSTATFLPMNSSH